MSKTCPDCEAPLLAGKCSKICGWKPRHSSGEPEKRNGRVVHRDVIPDELLQAEKERIAELKAQYPTDWQKRIKDYTDKQMAEFGFEAETHKKVEFKKYRQELREQVPQLSDTAFVCSSMPAPHDKEGMAEYKERLKRVQHVLPTTEAVNG